MASLFTSFMFASPGRQSAKPPSPQATHQERTHFPMRTSRSKQSTGNWPKGRDPAITDAFWGRIHFEEKLGNMTRLEDSPTSSTLSFALPRRLLLMRCRAQVGSRCSAKAFPRLKLETRVLLGWGSQFLRSRQGSRERSIYI